MYAWIRTSVALLALTAAAILTVGHEESAVGSGDRSLEYLPVQTEQTYYGPPPPPGAATAYVPADIPPDPNLGAAPVPDYPMYAGDPVIGGGLTGDPAARQQIARQLPPGPGLITGDGSSAVEFIRAVARFNSTASRAFSVLNVVADCAYQNGTFAARTYRQPNDFYWAGGVLVVSDRESRNIFQNLLGCAGDVLNSVMGSGPGASQFGPCSRSFTYATPYDRYYVVLGGATEKFCVWAEGHFGQFAPTRWP